MGSGTYHGEEAEKEDDDNENDSDDDHENKTKENSTPLWKYVTRLGKGKGGGTTKLTCPCCRKNFTSFIYPCEKASMWGYAMG